MKAKNWIVGWLVLVLIALGFIAGWVYKIDPYFHYHKPDTDNYYYSLNNQRSQNDGISKYFEYDALISGSSMTENFKTSEMDEIFGTNSIKISYSGASFKEINDSLIVALKCNPNLKTIVRGLDYGAILKDKDYLRTDLGTYPTYLYDSNPFNDVMYLFNKDVIFGRVYSMILQKNKEGFTPGITSFDDYSYWQNGYTFGINTVFPDGVINYELADVHLSDEEKEMVYGNITQNVTSLADQYPDVDFYYFFTPYSIAWWNEYNNNGEIYKYIEAEQYAIELILEHSNIKLYSFNMKTDITGDLNNYKDAHHYGEWVNSLMLRWMKDGECLLTKENYLEYINSEIEFYTTFDYASLNDQIDYENDFYAAALLNYEYSGAKPIDLLTTDDFDIEFSNASIINNQYENKVGLECIGSLKREVDGEVSVSDYLLENEYIGAKIDIDDIDNHHYLVFYGKKVKDHGQPSVFVYDANGNVLRDVMVNHGDIDNEWHQYVIDLSDIDGKITIILNGGYIDNTGSATSNYIFSGITLY